MSDLQNKAIGKLLLQYAMPAIIATTATSLFNTIDSIFIGQWVGAEAISALAVAFPFMNLTRAFGMLVGVGASMLTSIHMGKGEGEQVSKIFNNLVIINVVLAIVVSVSCLVYLDPILIYFGASENTLPHAREYMAVILLGNVITQLYFSLNSMLRATGEPEKSMRAILQTVLLNIILDALFIFVFDMGVFGAALATIISQVMTLIWQLTQIRSSNGVFKLNINAHLIECDTIKRMIQMGLPQFFINASACLVSILVNRELMEYGGDYAIGAYGISNRFIFTFLMIVIGICQAMQPIAGYNYGAKQYGRVVETYKWAVISALILTMTCLVTGLFFSYEISSLFTSDISLIEMTSACLSVMVLAMPFGAFQLVTSTLFQSMGKPTIATVLSLLRQVVIYIPTLYLLPKVLGLQGIWYSALVADCISVLVSALFVSRYFRRMQDNRLSLA